MPLGLSIIIPSHFGDIALARKRGLRWFALFLRRLHPSTNRIDSPPIMFVRFAARPSLFCRIELEGVFWSRRCRKACFGWASISNVPPPFGAGREAHYYGRSACQRRNASHYHRRLGTQENNNNNVAAVWNTRRQRPFGGEGFGLFQSLETIRLERERSVILRAHRYEFVSGFKNPYTFLVLLLDLALYWPSRVVLSLFI